MIYLVRHSETAWNREGRLQGHRDAPLTELGQTQARRMGAALRRAVVPLAEYAIVASPLGRTRHTAEIVCGELGIDPGTIAFDDRLKEIRWGDWEGFTRPEIERRWPGELARRRQRRWDYAPPNGESYAMLTERVGGWLATIGEDARSIVVTHGAAGRMIKGIYAKLDREVAMGLSEPQDAFFRLARGRIEEIQVESNPADTGQSSPTRSG